MHDRVRKSAPQSKVDDMPRAILVTCIIVGLVEVSVLGSLRLQGLLPPNYSWAVILGWPVVLIGGMYGLIHLANRFPASKG